MAARNHIYSPGWSDKYRQGMSDLTTSGGHPKLDFVSFTYHHALTTLIDRSVQKSLFGMRAALFVRFLRNALDKEIGIHKLIYAKTWGHKYSKGLEEIALKAKIIQNA